MADRKFTPCGFCGAHDKITACSNYAESWVRCHSCGATGPTTTDGASKAVALWNTRVRYESEGGVNG